VEQLAAFTPEALAARFERVIISLLLCEMYALQERRADRQESSQRFCTPCQVRVDSHAFKVVEHRLWASCANVQWRV
jgi:hypothetical protein